MHPPPTAANPRHLAALALLLTGASLEATGAGFALYEQSARNLGSAYAGGGSNAGREAATLFWNPAGMSLLKDDRVQAGATYFQVRSEFSDQGSTRTRPGADGAVTRTTMEGDLQGDVDAFIPSLYGVQPMDKRLHLGIGIFSNFGFRTAYDADWAGRYHALESDLGSLNVNPSLAYRVNDRLSLGAGFSAAYAEAELTRALYLPDGAGGRLPDGRVSVVGDDWGWGYNLGLLYEFSYNARIGIAYRSRIRYTLEGRRLVSDAGELSGRVGASSELTLPDSLILSGYWRVDPDWSLVSDLVWTGWSSFDETRVRFADGTPDDVTVHAWEDSWRFTLGTEYRLGPRWTLRTGLALDRSPVPDAVHRTPSIPDSDRRWFSLGLSWQPVQRIRIDMAYAHLFIDEARVDNRADLVPVYPGAYTDHLVGSFDSSADVVAVQMEVGY